MSLSLLFLCFEMSFLFFSCSAPVTIPVGFCNNAAPGPTVMHDSLSDFPAMMHNYVLVQ